MKGPVSLKLLVIFAVGLVLGVGIMVLFFHSSDDKTEPVAQKTPQTRQQMLDQANVTAEDIELVQGKQGAMVWKLLAKSAKYNQSKGLIGVEFPQLMAYYGKDRQEIYVRADRGDVDQQHDNLTLYDGVSGRFGDMALDSQQLDYVGAMDKVYLKGGVVVRRPDMTVQAPAVEFDLLTHKLVAAGGVEALLTPKGIGTEDDNKK